MVFGGQSTIHSNCEKKSVNAFGEEDVDPQDLLVENSLLRRQVASATERERMTQEENEDLKRQVRLLQQQSEQFKVLSQRFEAAEEQACKMALREADVEGDEGMRGLKPWMEGYLECKNTVLCARISAISKRSFWLQAQVEQARDQVADARRRQVDAERIVSQLLQGQGPEITTEYMKALSVLSTNAPTYQGPQLATGSAIFGEEKAFAEGLPKTIPSRAARCAALVTTALAHGQNMRSTVGRTVVSTSSSVAPTARPGNVWATLMNGGAAGAKIDFA